MGVSATREGDCFDSLQLHLEGDWTWQRSARIFSSTLSHMAHGSGCRSKDETHRKKKKEEKEKKGVPYVCLFLFISSQPNRSTSSAAWLKLMLLKMSSYTRTWHHKRDCSQGFWHCLEKEALKFMKNMCCLSFAFNTSHTADGETVTTWLPGILEVSDMER